MFYKKISYIVFIVFITIYNLKSQKISEKEISVFAKIDSLYGTLVLSKSKYLCIFHSDYGTDRNGNDDLVGENNSLKKLADSLANHNISSFRYDKRGIGKSKNSLEYEDSLIIQNYVDDLLLWIEYFSKPPYNYKEFVLIGHSEGALISTLAAQKSPKVKKLVLLAGAGFRGDTVIKRQLNYLHENARKVIFSIIDTLAKGKRIYNVPPALSMLFRESLQNYMISWLPLDPAFELSKIKIPVLIIQGDNDIQISIKDAERLKEYKKDAVLKIIPNMNHILVDSPKDKKENMQTYNNPDLPISKELIPAILNFIK